MSHSEDEVLHEVKRVPEHLRKVLDLLERWEARVSNVLDSKTEGHLPTDKVAKQISDLAKNSKPIAQEMRAWVDKTDQVVKNMSLEDKLAVSLRLIQGLSKGDRYKFYHRVIQAEKDRKDGGIIMAVTNHG